jgi:hypothetical protein
MTATGINAYLTVLQNRIDEIADQAGITGAARLSIDETLASLPKSARRRLFMLLESLRAFSPDQAQRAAAEAVQERAVLAWGDETHELMGSIRQQGTKGPTPS